MEPKTLSQIIGDIEYNQHTRLDIYRSINTELDYLISRLKFLDRQLENKHLSIEPQCLEDIDHLRERLYEDIYVERATSDGVINMYTSLGQYIEDLKDQTVNWFHQKVLSS